MSDRADDRRLARLMLCVLLACGVWSLLPGRSAAQDAAPPPATAPNVASATASEARPTIWDLAIAGGYFMIPIALCSVVVVAFTLERLVGLRGNKILPARLLGELDRLSSDESGLDPRQAYKHCQKYKSPLSNVIKAAILKVGRPQAELEKTVEDAVAREAANMATNIRPISVCASISPLLGLLGTVQGMILAFMVTSTTTATGTAKAQELAQGIYTALVTTFAGLSVAILAVLCAHYLEGRIERLLRDMEEIFLEILPQLERFEGKLRITRKSSARAEGTRSDSAASLSQSATAVTFAQRVPAAVPQPPADESADEAMAPKGLWGLMGEEEAPEESADGEQPADVGPSGQSPAVVTTHRSHAK